MAAATKRSGSEGRSAELVGDARSFLDRHVRPIYGEFARDPLSPNAILDCALSLSRVGDWLWHSHIQEAPGAVGLDPSASQEEFSLWARAECPSLALVEGVAAGARLCEPADTRKVSPSSVARRSSLPGGNFRSNRPLVAIRDEEGDYRDVESLFRETLAFWEKLLQATEAN